MLTPRIPLTDAPRLQVFRRRTALQRLAAAIVALLAALLVVLLARHAPAQPPSLLSPRSDALVVLDVSASISPDTYKRIDATLTQLARSNAHVGLILFSDTAYTALPPGTPAVELAPFARSYRLPANAGLAVTPSNPWTNAFSAGTKISVGLELALQTIRARSLGAPQVLLVSDLDDDSTDRERLSGIALTFRQLKIPVRVVGLNPSPDDERTVAGLLRNRGDLTLAQLPGRSAPAAPFPTGLVLAVVLTALALGAVALVETRLAWAPPR
jgi:hypothetical protein